MISSPSISKVNNFSAIRLYLALCVVVAHFYAVFQEPIFWIGTSAMAVKVFFILSGFLVTSSFLNSRGLKNYLAKRARRIFPSYLTVVLLCAFLFVGVSELSFADYFLSPDWLKYVASNVLTLNFLHISLPGVFGETAVNGSLWTIKVELACYLMIPLVIYFGRRKLSIVGWIMGLTALLSILFSYYAYYRHGVTGNGTWLVMERQIFGQIAYFFCGSLFCIFYEALKDKLKTLLIVGVVILVLSYLVRDLSLILNPLAYTLIFIPLALLGRWGNLPTQFDISYELYLVHFPIMKLLSEWSIHETLGTAGAFTLAVIASLTAAFLLWNLLGRRFLRRTAPSLRQLPA